MYVSSFRNLPVPIVLGVPQNGQWLLPSDPGTPIPDVFCLDAGNCPTDVTVHFDLDVDGSGSFSDTDAVASFTVKAGGVHSFANPRPAATGAQFRLSSSSSGLLNVTCLNRHSGVQV
jgi:hypothetical protein